MPKDQPTYRDESISSCPIDATPSTDTQADVASAHAAPQEYDSVTYSTDAGRSQQTNPNEALKKSPELFDEQQTPEKEYEYQTREEIVALDSWCTASQGSDCTRCVAVCPKQAITLTDEGPVIDPDQCSRCGLCAGICDAFAWKRITLEDLVERCKREAKSEGYVCFTCNEHIFAGLVVRSNVVVLPCLAAVPPEFWSALLAQQIHVGIFLDRTYCDDCTTAGTLAPVLFDHALNQAQSWTQRSIEELDLIPERESILSLYANVDKANRRSLLSALANEGIDIATGKHRRRNAATVDSFHENQERLRAQGRIRSSLQEKNMPTILAKKKTWPRQKLIVGAAQAMPEHAENLERYQSSTNVSLCHQNHACVNACPTGARTVDDQGYPKVDAKRCIACGICIVACKQHACDFSAITAKKYCERIPDD